MTRLQYAVLFDDDGCSPMSLNQQDIHPNPGRETSSTNESNESRYFDNCENGVSDDDLDDIKSGPLGYQHFLYDVNFEFSPGGTRPNSNENKYCFRMKCLPYMIGRNFSEMKSQKPNDIIDCDGRKEENCDDSSKTIFQNYDPTHIDVTRTTCAFLGHNEYVPNGTFKRRRVVLELISAKLSQSTYYVTPNSSYTNLITLNEDPFQQSSINNRSSSTNYPSPKEPNPNNNTISAPPSSKKFVNYTILIKTVPGLDKHPAVIERRFSDFLNLYQGLKCHKLYANIVDDYVAFPKKVYMGNFSLTKIAERSIEFARLLSLCMSKTSLLWSIPFVSFLVDKELKDAHRLSLFGDPDDVQALLETAYFIEQKLYIGNIQAPSNSCSSNTSDLSDDPNNRYSPMCSNGRSILIQAPSNETISADSNQYGAPGIISTDQAFSPSPNQSFSESGDDFDGLMCDRASLSSLNQRIIVTFCMLVVVYCRGKNYRELKQAVQQFKQLISSQDVVESLINTRHYDSLRACLLFLMNLNRNDVIDDETRIWLKRRLEDIDAACAELDSVSMTDSTDNHYTPASGDRARKYCNGRSSRGSNHVSRNDLTSLLRDKKFCLFQDGKFSQHSHLSN